MTEEIRQAEWRGWAHAIDAVRGSLRDYPLAGGDIGIMTEVERLLKEQRELAYLQGMMDGLEAHASYDAVLEEESTLG